MLFLSKTCILMRYLLIAFLLLFVTTRNIFPQIIQSQGVQPEEGTLSLKLKSLCFIENNEYFNPVIEGYTLPGFFFQPQLVYIPSSKVTLRAGAHLLKYYGTGKFSQVRPVFSASLNLTKKTTLTIGTLSGSDKHRFFDPHFDNERFYTAYAEDGFQLTSSNEHIFNDMWLNWENFIFKGDTTREVFTFGESFRYTSSTVADFLQIEIPVQVQFKHFGGQISNYPGHIETYFNLATGLRINFDLAQKRYGQAGIEYLQFINKEFPGESPSGITSGYGSWLRLHYTYKAIYIGAAYWKSRNFYSPNGNKIYSSVSDYQENIIVPDRKIITNYYYLTLLPESYFELFLGLETYYDIYSKRMDSSLTLHLNFDKLIKLATIKH
jgi:hypothetical protein